MTIKAIETRYKGYRFRSRLEARWAVFFESLGITWEYEPEGYEDVETREKYLPDFKLSFSDFTCWIEIKPTPPNRAAINKLALPVIAEQEHAFLFWGRPGCPKVRFASERWELKDGALGIELTPPKDHNAPAPLNALAGFIPSVVAWSEQVGTGVIEPWNYYPYEIPSSIQLYGMPISDELVEKHLKETGQIRKNMVVLVYPNGISVSVYIGPGRSYNSTRLQAAYDAARSARFEHGGGR